MPDSPVPVSMGSPRFKVHDLHGCRVTLVWFPPNAVLEPHLHDRPTFAVILMGGFDLRLTSPTNHRRELACTPGTILVQPAGERHANHFVTDGAGGVVIQPDPDASDLPPRCLTMLRRINHFRDGPIAAAARTLAREMTWPDDVTLLAIEALALEMLAEAAQLARDAPVRPGDGPAWLRRATEYIHDHFRDPIRIADIAGIAGVHPAHLAAVFSRAHRMPLARYIRRLRVDWAADQLLATDTPVAAVAGLAGFADQAHLTRWFRREIGATPAAYRRARRRQPARISP